MRGGLGLKGLGLLLLLVMVAMCSRFDLCDARRGRHWRPRAGPSSSSLAKKKGKGKPGGNGGGGGGHRHGDGSSKAPPNPPKDNPGYQQPPQPSVVYNVLDFGAKGNGLTDDTKAFQAAWAAACKEEASTVLVPPGYQFLVGPISFSGPYCRPNLVFQLEGTIIAPTASKAWGSGLLQWLEFTKLSGITIQGRGIIDGRGSVWWTYADANGEPISTQLSSKMPSIKPTALRFYGSYNVTVTGITIQNSPQCHLKFDNCEAVKVFNMTVSSPGNSLNTDGIHLQNSRLWPC